MKKKTLFQKIIDREIPAKIELETKDIIVIHDINPQAKIHCLIIPKKPIAKIQEIENGDFETLGKIFEIAKKLSEKLEISDFRLVLNNGNSAGQTVDHIHVHFLSGRSFDWPPG